MRSALVTRHYLAALVALAGSGLGVSAGGAVKDDLPKPLPPEIAKAWTDAGAQVGWIRMEFEFRGDYGRFIHADKAPVGELPAFQYGTRGQWKISSLPRWKAGVLEKLPDPGVPFALILSTTEVRNAGLKELAGFKSLRMLNLGVTWISDAGIRELAGLKNLQWLSLSNTGLTDAGLKELAGLSNLRSFDLYYTSVSDAGLVHLSGMKSALSQLNFRVDRFQFCPSVLNSHLPIDAPLRSVHIGGPCLGFCSQGVDVSKSLA